MVQIWSKAIVMLCPESSLEVKLTTCRNKNMDFTSGYKCKRKNGDCSSQRKINVNLILGALQVLNLHSPQIPSCRKS